MSDLTRLWPAAGLRVVAGDLELRWIDDDLLVELADLAARGVHDAVAMPFLFPWTRGTPHEVARRVVAYQWGVRPAVGPERLALELAVLRDGVPVGVQAASGSDWAALRTLETGSWLGRAHQGDGVGTRMRVMMLHLVFAELGAAEVTSTAFVDNPASCRVSERAGYLDNGTARVLREGVATTQRAFRLPRERWEELVPAHRSLLGGDVTVTGAEAVREHLGDGDVTAARRPASPAPAS